MVKVTNVAGDSYVGGIGNQFYQGLYGQSVRKKKFKRNYKASPMEQENRDNFKQGSDWLKTLTQDLREGLKIAYETFRHNHPDHNPMTWHSFGMYVHLTKPSILITT